MAVNLFNAAKELGHYPKESKATDDAGQKEYQLAKNIRMARKRKVFTPEEESELDLLQAEADGWMCLTFNCCLLKTTFGTHAETRKKKDT